MNEWFDRLWENYILSCPDALKIHKLLEDIYENAVNDHIAIRTFNGGGISLDDLRPFMVHKGFEPMESYRFAEKKLNAVYFQHPDLDIPRVFISELEVEAFSSTFQRIIGKLLDQSEAYVHRNGVDIPLIPWEPISYSDYQLLLEESDYASWLAVHGLKANHFTVLVNSLKNFDNIESLNLFLRDHGFTLNTVGGEVKGSEEQLLKQSSTMAVSIVKNFSDGIESVPGCFYEFAQRCKKVDGELFYGFIANSASKIFESTKI